MSSMYPYPYSGVVVSLVKGVVYDTNEELWRQLVNYESEIKKYFEVMGMQLYLDETEGYAFLRQIEINEDDNVLNNIPKLLEKRQLSYPITILCVLLRKKLLEADAEGGKTRVVIEKEKVKEMLSLFLPQTSNEAKSSDKMDEYINKVVDYGFLRKLKNNKDEYEINRVIKARISADTLQHIEQELKEYAETIS